MDTQEKQDVVKQLRAHLDRLQQASDALAGGFPLKGAAKEQAQALLKIAKHSLKDDYKRMSTRKAQTALNETERAYLYHTVHEASSRIQVKWNSNPSPRWSSDLYDARGDIEFYLRQLESERAGKSRNLGRSRFLSK